MPVGLSCLVLGSDIGSTEIILRSQQAGLTTSPEVGQGLSGNGSSLSFGYDLNHRFGKVSFKDAPGHMISGMVTCQNDNDWEEDFIVQDGVRTNILSTAFRLAKSVMPYTAPAGESFTKTLRRRIGVLNPFTTEHRITLKCT